MQEPETTFDLTAAEPVATAAARPRGRVIRVAGVCLIAVAVVIGLFLVYLFGASRIIEERSQRMLLPEFRSLTQQGPATTTDWRPAPGQPVALLSIPKIGLEEIVVEGTSASALTQGPGHLRESPVPGRPGNSVIAGRRTTFGAPFRNLDVMRAGDEIHVITGQGAFTYKVTSIGSVMPGQVDPISPSAKDQLTLVTSAPAYTARGRLVVVAELTSDPAPGPALTTQVIPSDETGLAGQPAKAGWLLLLIEAAAAVALGAVWFSRRISTRVAVFLATPLVLALLWATFGITARLLPATL